MGRFERPARRFVRLSRIFVNSPLIDKLRPLAQYILLIILSAVHLANQYRNIENKGIAYASFLGSILVNLRNIAFEEDRASALHAAIQDWQFAAGDKKSSHIRGFRSLGLLSSIIIIPIRLEQLTTGALAHHLFPRLLGGILDQEMYLVTKIPAVFFLVVLQISAVILSAALNAVGLVLIPISFFLLVIDILSIEFVETVLVAFAENLPWIPDLNGVEWAYASLGLTLCAVLTAILNDYIAWIAWMRDDLVYSNGFALNHLITEYMKHNITPRKALELIRDLPYDHESALAVCINGLNNDINGNEDSITFVPIVTKQNELKLSFKKTVESTGRFYSLILDPLTYFTEAERFEPDSY